MDVNFDGLSNGVITSWNSTWTLSSSLDMYITLFTIVSNRDKDQTLSLLNMYGTYDGIQEF